MRFEFFDHTSQTTLIKFESADTEFGSNVFNLFMAEMVRLHGSAFRKLSSGSLGEDGISLMYTHNISGLLKP